MLSLLSVLPLLLSLVLQPIHDSDTVHPLSTLGDLGLATFMTSVLWSVSYHGQHIVETIYTPQNKS